MVEVEVWRESTTQKFCNAWKEAVELVALEISAHPPRSAAAVRCNIQRSRQGQLAIGTAETALALCGLGSKSCQIAQADNGPCCALAAPQSASCLTIPRPQRHIGGNKTTELIPQPQHIGAEGGLLFPRCGRLHQAVTGDRHIAQVCSSCDPFSSRVKAMGEHPFCRAPGR